MIAILGKTSPPDQALARRMLAAAPHRGTDVTLRVLGNAILGVATRPDLVNASISAEGSTIAALMGRLDNAQELCRDVTSTGTAPAGNTDADIVVAAFKALGTDAPRRMRGCFAGAVSDGRTLWCFRDHVGFGPLFYHDGPQAFVAATEPRQIAVGAKLSEEPDLHVLELFFYGTMPADTPAALKGVSRLAQGRWLRVDPDHAPTIERFWRPVELLETARLAPTDVRDRFLELMAQAVTRTLRKNDVVLLSGGVDSPAIAAFAAPGYRENTGRALGALSLVFPDLPAVDELPFIKIVTERFGIELHTYRPTARALDDVDTWTRRLGSPVPVLSIPEIYDNHARARALGYDNILTGDFAEFAFGLPIHIVPHLLTHFRWAALARLLLTERRHGASGRQLAKYVGETFVPGRLANWYLERRGLDAPQRIPDWLDTKKVNENPFRADLLPPARKRWLEAQLAGTEGATIAMETAEVAATVAGVTARRPFADVDLWEFFLSLPAEVKCPDLRFKTLVKGLLRGHVPDEILDRRRKTVFDDHTMSQVDYPTLRRLLLTPRHHLAGVDYGRLAERIERQDFNRFDWYWAKDLAQIHSFLSAW